MRFLRAAAFALLVATPAAADEAGEPILPGEEELRALGEEAEAMLRRFAETLDPMAKRLRALIDDLDAYEAPERLPNGDIIIRRKPEAPDPPPDGGISL
ncbi:MAG: hypothetical protein ACE37J_21455 [Pikeienuella sp.]|uniref:hypothetical protein n=1 Tax=Pikeienuella sp. TaxID=2831957 RepID=UPI00391D6F9C